MDTVKLVEMLEISTLTDRGLKRLFKDARRKMKRAMRRKHVLTVVFCFEVLDAVAAEQASRKAGK